jgi:hypothetical protein
MKEKEFDIEAPALPQNYNNWNKSTTVAKFKRLGHKILGFKCIDVSLFFDLRSLGDGRVPDCRIEIDEEKATDFYGRAVSWDFRPEIRVQVSGKSLYLNSKPDELYEDVLQELRQKIKACRGLEAYQAEGVLKSLDRRANCGTVFFIGVLHTASLENGYRFVWTRTNTADGYKLVLTAFIRPHENKRVKVDNEKAVDEAWAAVGNIKTDCKLTWVEATKGKYVCSKEASL